MRREDLVLRHAGPALEAVDILRDEGMEEAFPRQQRDKRVRDRGFAPPRISSPGHGIERLRGVAEVRDVEGRLGIGEMELRQLRVEARVRGPEIRDAGRDGDASAGEDDDVAGLAGCDQIGDAVNSRGGLAHFVDRLVFNEQYQLG